MAKYRALIIAGGAFFALARAAGAADLLPPPPALEPPPPAAMEFNGWYLRGDVGIGISANTPNLSQLARPAAGRIAQRLLHRRADRTSSTIRRSPPRGSSISASAISSTTGSAPTSPANTAADRTSSRSYVLNDPTNTGTRQSDPVAGLLSRRPLVVGRPGQRLRRFGHVVRHYALCRRRRRLRAQHAVRPDRSGPVYLSAPDRRRRPSGGYFGDDSQVELRLGADGRPDFDVTQNLKLDLGYRYLDLGKFSSGALALLERHRRRRRLGHSYGRSSRRTTSPTTTSASACAG